VIIASPLLTLTRSIFAIAVASLTSNTWFFADGVRITCSLLRSSGCSTTCEFEHKYSVTGDCYLSLRVATCGWLYGENRPELRHRGHSQAWIMTDYVV
jgi:hypothetical protein